MPTELIDTHAHLDEEAFATDCDDVISRAVEAGLAGVMTIGTTAQSSRRAVELAHKYSVVHSFCGHLETTRRCLDLGLHISFAGMLTYKKNDALRDVAAEIPLDRLLVETDSPYLAPAPKRGKRNEPAFVRHTAA